MKKKDWQNQQSAFLQSDISHAKSQWKYAKSKKKKDASNASFISLENKTEEKKEKRFVKQTNAYVAQRKQRRKTALALAAIGATGVLGGYLLASTIRATILNNAHPTKDPLSSDRVIDPNGNDFEFGNDGQIVYDKMSDADKTVLSDKLSGLILSDANSRNFSGKKIESIKQIVSMSLIPCNLCEDSNQFDKYFLSILFNDGQNTYALNYLTGKDLETDAQVSTNLVVDFVNFLEFDCALDSCLSMDEIGQSLKDVIGDEAIFVGDAFFGYQSSGDECWAIPVYGENGTGKIYSALSGLFGGLIEEENPKKALLNELTTSASKIFSETSFVESKNLQAVVKIIQENLNLETSHETSKNASSEMTK